MPDKTKKVPPTVENELTPPFKNKLIDAIQGAFNEEFGSANVISNLVTKFPRQTGPRWRVSIDFQGASPRRSEPGDPATRRGRSQE